MIPCFTLYVNYLHNVTTWKEYNNDRAANNIIRNDTVLSKIVEVAKTIELQDEERAIVKNLSVQARLIRR